MPGNGKPKKTEPHHSWVKFFSYAQALRDGVISRLVIQNDVPVFMEQSFDNINLSKAETGKWTKGAEGKAISVSEYSPEWAGLVRIASDLTYCEFHNLKISGGVPVSIGKLINKEKFA